MNNKDKQKQIAAIPLETKLQMLLQNLKMCRLEAHKLGFKPKSDLSMALFDAQCELEEVLDISNA